MKQTKKLFFVILSLVLTLAFVFSAVGCGGEEEDPPPGPNPPDEQATVSELIIDAPPTTLEYYSGEAFDPSGMIVKAKWSDGLTSTVAVSECTIEPSGALDPDTESVKISYGGKSATQAITVKSAVVTSLDVDTGNIALKAAVGTVMDFSGIKVTTNYEDGGSRLLSGGYTFNVDGEETDDVSALTFDKSGTHTLTVVYGTTSKDVSLEIFYGVIVEAENILKDGEITEDTRNYVKVIRNGNNGGTPHKRAVPDEPASGGAYMGGVFTGSAFRFHLYSEEDCNVKIILRASSAYMTVDGGAWSPMEIGDQQFNRLFNISYGSAADMENNALKPLYIEDDVVLEGGSTEKPGGDPLLYVNWKDVNFGTLPLVRGDNIIEFDVISDYVNCKGEQIACNIDRLEVETTDDDTPPVTVESITLRTPPAKTEYKSGESFDPTGMEIVANMSDDTTKAIDNNKLTITPSGALTVSDTEVTVSYFGKSVTVPVTVTAAEAIKIEGENITDTANVTDDMKNFVEKINGYASGKNAEKADEASGGKFLGAFMDGAQVRFHIWADEAGKADITIRAASTNITAGNWWATEVGDSQLNRFVAFKFGTADNLADVTVGDDVVLPGSSVGEGEDGTTKLLENWFDVNLGSFDLQAGDNILEMTVINETVYPQTGERCGCNIDYLTVAFK